MTNSVSNIFRKYNLISKLQLHLKSKVILMNREISFEAVFKNLSAADPPIPHNNSTNDRLHIQFHHSGLRCFISNEDSLYKVVLNGLWKIFGNPSNVYYHKDFQFCLVSFRTHVEAETALMRLNDAPHLQEIITTFKSAAIEKLGDMGSVNLVNNVFQNLFRGGIRASWASARLTQDTFRSNNDGDYYIGNDIPDGFIEEEWESICEGRGS